MSSLYVAPLLAVLLVGQGEQGAKSDLSLLQGKWKTVSLVVNGNTVPAERYADEVVTISGTERLLKRGTKLAGRATIAIHPGTNPKGIDFTFTEGEYKGTTLRGIYKFEDGILSVNMDLGQDRPDDFTCPKSSSRMLQKFKRVVEK